MRSRTKKILDSSVFFFSEDCNKASLGKPLSKALYYDLSAVEFDFTSSSADMLHKLLCPRVAEKDFNALADAKVLIIGCGGLGSPAAFALASLGIGGLGLVDFDTDIYVAAHGKSKYCDLCSNT